MTQEFYSWRTQKHEFEKMAIEKNELLSFAATWMDLKICTLNEVRQTEEDKYIIYMLNLKKKCYK